MKLFENTEININKIHSVDIYDREHSAGDVVCYGTYTYMYELIFFLSGRGEVSVDDKKIDDFPFSVRYLPKGKLLKEYKVKTIEPGACIDIYFDTASPMPLRALGLGEYKNLKDKFLNIYSVWKEKKPGYYAKAMMIFYDIISEFQKKDKEYIGFETSKKISASYDYILKHYKDLNFDYKALCAESGFKYAYFSEQFKKAYSSSPVKTVTRLKIDYAKELLVTNRFSVSEIAEMCGFDNVYYFSSVFKKQTGFSPTAYLKGLIDG